MRWLLLLLALLSAPLAAAEGERLRIGVNGLPVSLGNPYKGNGRPGSLVWSAIFDTLVVLDEQGRQRPSLATSWQAVTPTLWRFQLRPGVRFANGRRLDAAAAARTFNWLASEQGRSTVIGNELRAVESARATGPLTLDIITSRPDPILPKRLVAAYIVEPEHWARLGPDGFALAPIGSGPYRLQAWDQRRRRAELAANPHAWRAPRVPTRQHQPVANTASAAPAPPPPVRALALPHPNPKPSCPSWMAIIRRSASCSLESYSGRSSWLKQVCADGSRSPAP